MGPDGTTTGDTVPAPGQVRLSSLDQLTLLKTIGALAAPVVMGQISQTLMGLVDTLMVGRLGAEALAAVAVATLLFSALAMSVKAVDVAVQTFTARRVGEGRDDEVGAVFATAVTVCLGAGVVCMALGLLRPGFLMGLVSADPVVQELGGGYLVYRYAGILPLLFYFQAKGMFDGIGWTRIGMGVGIGMNVANVGLNWLLIFGKLGAPRLGVPGAAAASSLSALLAALVMLGFVLHRPIRKRFRLVCRSNFRPDLVGPFLRIAWPPAAQALGVVFGLLIFNFLLGRIGTLAVATGNVVLRIASLSFMPGFGAGAAVQTLVGQSLGRGDPVGARRATWGGVGLSVIFMGLFGVVFVLVPGQLMRLFSDRADLVAAGVPILRLMGLVQVIDGVGLVLAGALRGAGLTRAVMFMDVGLGFVLLPPLTYLFGIVLGWGLFGAWLALMTWFSLFAVGMVWIWFRSDWENRQL